jgi:hypothetical protein
MLENDFDIKVIRRSHDPIDRGAAIECLLIATKNGYCDIDYAIALIKDLPRVRNGEESRTYDKE